MLAERTDKAGQSENQVPGTEAQLVKLRDRVRDCLALRERESKAVAAFLEGQQAP
jgi:hypothetical protein